jgi:hypothetical protein
MTDYGIRNVRAERGLPQGTDAAEIYDLVTARRVRESSGKVPRYLVVEMLKYVALSLITFRCQDN